VSCSSRAPHEATIGGHVVEQLGRPPVPDELVDIGGAQLRIVAVDDTRVTALEV
jgi:CBS domain containing-hemolysin-like protein